MFNSEKILTRLSNSKDNISKSIDFEQSGTLIKATGLTLEARGLKSAIGTVCKIIDHENNSYDAVVTGFNNKKLFLMTLDHTKDIAPGAKIISTGENIQVLVSDDLLGRVIDGLGRPLDGKKELTNGIMWPLIKDSINPLLADSISKPLDVGVKAINSLLTIGQGQRIGLFAGSGVGKSVLLGMLAKYAVADVIVVALIGERGREVKEFIEKNLTTESKQRAVIVASPANYSPLIRLNGAFRAVSIAEYFSSKGKSVLLLMDSLTRFAQAQREIALAMGEPPATKGYPPSVFSLLPNLIERIGNGNKELGPITGLFTVLAEGDDQQDPIVDTARAILDGHIVLSRKYAEQGHYPAIDIEASISRVMSNVVSKEHSKLAIIFKRYLSTYNENKDLINIGAYSPGMNKDLDAAIKKIDNMNAFLNQEPDQYLDFNSTFFELNKILID